MCLGRFLKYTDTTDLFFPKIHKINSNLQLEFRKSTFQSVCKRLKERGWQCYCRRNTLLSKQMTKKKLFHKSGLKNLLSEFNLKIIVWVPSLTVSVTVPCKSQQGNPTAFGILHIKSTLKSLKELPNRCCVLPTKRWRFR